MKHMKQTFLLAAVASFGIFALAGCGKTSENTNTAANGNTAVKTNTAATNSEEPAARMLKPGDVSLDNTVKVLELVDSIAADTNRDAWKGKEVVVTGFVNSTSSSGKFQLVTLTNDKAATQSKSVSCSFQAASLPDGVAFQTVEVKGKIKYIQMNGESKSVTLEPCELIKKQGAIRKLLALIDIRSRNDRKSEDEPVGYPAGQRFER